MTRCPNCFTALPAPARPGYADEGRRRRTGPLTEPAAPAPLVTCPSCGTGLPPGWTGHGSTCLVMAGARTTGKSIFIAVMVEQLRRRGPQLGVEVRMTPEVEKRFREIYLEPLYAQRGVMQATRSIELEDAYQREPLVFDLIARDNRVHHLVIRDVAGEDLERPDDIRPGQLDFFAAADCVVFLYDPLTVGAIAAKVPEIGPGRSRLGLAAKPVLDTTLRMLRAPTRLAVVMSKFDVVQALRAIEGSEELSAIMRNPGSTLSRDRGPRLDDIELLHEEVRSLLLTLGADDFVAAVDREVSGRPGAARYFAVSALGAPPRGQFLHTRGIAPFRCLDPLQWALAESGFALR